MTPELLDRLICPSCDTRLRLGDGADEKLLCDGCGKTYTVTRRIPRFVDAADNYAENFGVQWQRFRTVQIDRLAGHDLSATRFLNDTGWTPQWIAGKVILDAGCGAGRFTDVMAELGAKVIACDLSSAVEACRVTADDRVGISPSRGTVDVVQADLMRLPLAKTSFDAVHCAGVIQHTADPEAVMRALAAYVKPGGKLFFNFYEVDPLSRFQVFKYFMRRWTPHWPASRLHAFCAVLCRLFFLPSALMARLPVLRAFNRFLPICSTHPAGVPLRAQYTMTLLDTIDWYGPRFEQRQRHTEVAALLRTLGFEDVRSDPGRAWGGKRID